MIEDNPAAPTDITEQRREGRDPPLGATAGVIGGAVTGALVAVAAGPVGSLLGAVGAASLGGALGALTTVGPQIDVSKEDCYWREHYATRPYVPAGADYATGGRHTGMARACQSTA